MINDTLRLTEAEIWIQDQARTEAGESVFGHDIPHKNRKVRFFNGWIALKRNHIDEDAADDDWIYLKDLRVHNEGQIIRVLDDGKPTGYAIQLERLTYQNTQVAVLKLGVIDEATGKTLSYSWTNPGAERIGINLRWIQAGLTSVDPSNEP